MPRTKAFALRGAMRGLFLGRHGVEFGLRLFEEGSEIVFRASRNFSVEGGAVKRGVIVVSCV